MTDEFLEQIKRHKIVLKYIVVGICSAFIDVSVIYILKNDFGIWYPLAGAGAFLCSFAFAFVLQKFWTFRDLSQNRISGQVLGYLLAIAVSFVINMGVLVFLVEIFRVGIILAQIIAVVAAGIVSFLINVRNVFHEAGDKSGVVFASAIFPPDVGGPATFVFNLSKRLVEKGIKITVVTYSDKEKDEVKVSGLHIVRVSRRLPYGLRHFEYAFWLYLAAINHDIIYAQDITAAGLPALLVKKLLSRKLVLRVGGDLLWERAAEKGRTVLSMEQFYKSGKAKKFLVFNIGKKIFGECDKIFVTADNLRELYVKYYKVDKRKIETLHNPLPDMKDLPIFITPFHSEQEEKIVLFAGRFVKYKNLDKLVKSFNELYSEIKPARLILAGDGPEEGSLRTIIKKIDNPAIEIVNRVSHDSLMSYAARAQVCVSTATTEYNPNFILECLALGKNVLLNRDNGLTVKLPEDLIFDSPGDFKNKLRNLMNINFTSLSLKKLVSDTAAENSWDNIVLRHLELFNYIVNK